MSHKLICSWLGLPEEIWPPDHYLLLGLEPGEGDAERIERHVHELWREPFEHLVNRIYEPEPLPEGMTPVVVSGVPPGAIAGSLSEKVR